MINETLATTADLYEYSYSILKNATLLEFDRVYNETHKLDTIYNENIKESVSNLFNGKNSCCILFGPTESGKSYTLRGPCDNRSNEYGIIGRVIQDVLNLVELSKQTSLSHGNNHNKLKSGSTYFAAKLSLYQVYLDQINDLLSLEYNKNMKIERYFDEESNLMKTQICDLTEKEIKSKSDFDSLMREAVRHRKSLAQYLRINDSKRKSHFVVSVIIEKRERVYEGFKRSAEKTIARYAQLDFLELASSNFGLASLQKRASRNDLNSLDTDEVLFKNTSRTFNSICNNIVSASIGVVPKYDTKLTLALKNTLNFDSNIVFISCVLPSEEPPTKSIKSLKFTNWLRNQIHNLQCNKDYKIKSAYEDSEDEVVQRDYPDYARDSRDTRERRGGNNDSKLMLDSYKDFDNYYNYKRNQNKNYVEDKTIEDDYDIPQRFSTPVVNYQDIDRSINMNRIDHQSLYDKYQTKLERQRERDRHLDRNSYVNDDYYNYEMLSPISKSRKEINYTKPEPEGEILIDDEYDNIKSNISKQSRDNSKPNKYQRISINNNYNEDTEDNEDISDYIENEKNHHSMNKSHVKPTRSDTNVIDDEKDKKLKEVERSLRDLEAKSLEMSRYIDGMKAEKSRINDESLYNNTNTKTGCDCDIEKIKQDAFTLKSDNIIFREDINRLSDINRHLEEELVRQRNRNLDLAADNEKLAQDKIQMKCEIDKLNENNSKIKTQEHNLVEQLNLRFTTENRIRDLEIDNKTLREEKQKFEVDYKVLLERHNELKKVHEQTESELNFLKIRQNEEVNNIEVKLDKMGKEIEIQQRENSQLRLAEERMRQEISNLEKQRDNYRDKYQDFKLKNNVLNTKLTEVDYYL